MLFTLSAAVVVRANAFSSATTEKILADYYYVSHERGLLVVINYTIVCIGLGISAVLEHLAS